MKDLLLQWPCLESSFRVPFGKLKLSQQKNQNTNQKLPSDHHHYILQDKNFYGLSYTLGKCMWGFNGRKYSESIKQAAVHFPRALKSQKHQSIRSESTLESLMIKLHQHIFVIKSTYPRNGSIKKKVRWEYEAVSQAADEQEKLITSFFSAESLVLSRSFHNHTIVRCAGGPPNLIKVTTK